MAIDYLEIRNQNREVVGIIDTAKSVIWHSVYYGVGDFEIYAKATVEHINLLKQGYYVTRQNDLEVGIIESLTITQNMQDGDVIIASGRFAKSILDRRHIYKLSGKTNTPTILRGNVETAVRSVVSANAINCSFDSRRNISFLELGQLAGLPAIIVDESGNASQKQVSYNNLLEYTDEVLQEYGYASLIVLDNETKKLQYCVYAGADRSTDNTSGNYPVVFSQEYDNLNESNYKADNSLEKNVALIGGAGEGLQRFYSLLAGSQSGLARRETFVDASSVNRTYEEEGTEKTYPDAEYTKMINALGKQQLAKRLAVETFSGTIDVTACQWKINVDYSLGDIVTVQDNKIGKYVDVRILETTEVQDENGYSIIANYQ